MSLRVNLVVMLLAVISLGKTFQVRPRSIKFDINSGADKKYGPKEPSLGHVNSEKTNLIVNHQDQMQIREIQSRDFLDETNDALEDATSTLKNVQSYMKQAVAARKHKSNRRMMALLIAYKMKLLILIPMMIGTLTLLTSTTALAGFFFALFAAVLGLKAE